MQTVTIPTQHLNMILGAFDRLRRKAKRAGMPEPQITYRSAGIRPHRIAYAQGHELIERTEPTQFFDVRFEGLDVNFEGWSCLGSIECVNAKNGEYRNLLWGNVPAEMINAAPVCDHCGTSRRRKKTFLLQRGEETQRVGSTCLKEILKQESMSYLLAVAETWAVIISPPREVSSGGWRLPQGFSALAFHNAVAQRIAESGWVSRQNVMDGNARKATVDEVINTLNENSFKYEPKFEAEINAALAWIAGTAARSNFMLNLQTVASCETITHKMAGTAAYLLVAYRKSQAEEQARKAVTPSEFIGSVGDRLKNLTGIYQGSSSYETQWGTTHFHRFLCGTNRVTIKGTNGMYRLTGELNVAPGATCQIGGTIVKHETYNEMKSTILNRGKLAVIASA